MREFCHVDSSNQFPPRGRYCVVFSFSFECWDLVFCSLNFVFSWIFSCIRLLLDRFMGAAVSNAFSLLSFGIHFPFFSLRCPFFVALHPVTLHLMLTPHAGRYYARILSSRQFRIFNPCGRYCVVFSFFIWMVRHASFVLLNFVFSWIFRVAIAWLIHGCGRSSFTSC